MKWAAEQSRASSCDPLGLGSYKVLQIQSVHLPKALGLQTVTEGGDPRYSNSRADVLNEMVELLERGQMRPQLTTDLKLTP